MKIPWDSDTKDAYQYYEDWEAWLGNILDSECLGGRSGIPHNTTGKCSCISCVECPCASCEVARWWDNASMAIKTALFSAFEQLLSEAAMDSEQKDWADLSRKARKKWITEDVDGGGNVEKESGE